MEAIFIRVANHFNISWQFIFGEKASQRENVYFSIPLEQRKRAKNFVLLAIEVKSIKSVGRKI
jgi:hypothetical protein